MGGLKRKLEGEIEIKVAGGDAFHEIVQNNPHHLSNIHPELVQACDCHDGAFGTIGSKICWSYTIAGKPQSAIEILELVDEENKMMRFRVLEGDLMKDYNTFVLTYQVIPEGGELSIVKWILEYEKKHNGIPEPSLLMDALLELAKEVDNHHHRQHN